MHSEGERIVAAFDAAADSYDARSHVQRDIARALVARVRAEKPAKILDLGAGAGHVTGFAREKWPDAELTALDAAPKMLARLREKYPDVRSLRADAASFDTPERYDLILSSMMLHWLPDPRGALEGWLKLLAPGGALHVALPVAGSLGEWRALLAAAGLADSLWAFPAENFAQGLAACEIVAFPTAYDSAQAFAQSLKKTGAHRARPGLRPLPAGALRKVLTRQSGAFTATFRVAFLTAP